MTQFPDNSSHEDVWNDGTEDGEYNIPHLWLNLKWFNLLFLHTFNITKCFRESSGYSFDYGEILG